MKWRAAKGFVAGLTTLEGLVIIICFTVLAVLFVAAADQANHGASRISCVNNLKQIGTAYRIWENDNNDDRYPFQQPFSRGGAQTIISNSPSAGAYAWMTYPLMQNELGQSPKVVVCPSDKRVPSRNFCPAPDPKLPTNMYQPGPTGTFDNTSVSYFCGVGAIDTFPVSLLGGDRNLGDAGT